LPRASILTWVAVVVVCLAGPGEAAPSVSAVLTVSATVEPSCRLNTAPITFANRTAARVHAEAEGAIIVDCTPETSFAVSIDNGRHPDGSQRRLLGTTGGAYLDYEIFFDAARTRSWTGGAAGALLLTSSPQGGPVTIPAFAEISTARAVPDRYADQVTVTVSF